MQVQGAPVRPWDTMSEVTVDQPEGEREDVILNQQQKANQETKKKSESPSVTKYHGVLLSVGTIIFLTCVTLYRDYNWWEVVYTV